MGDDVAVGTKRPKVSKNKTVVRMKFSADQRKELENATGLTGLTGIDLVDLGSEERARIMPGLARATVAVLCW